MPHHFTQVLIDSKALKKLKKVGLDKNYLKAKKLLLAGQLSAVSFKKRRPYKTEKYYFRLNQKYRAHAFIEGTILKIFLIDDHQI